MTAYLQLKQTTLRHERTCLGGAKNCFGFQRTRPFLVRQYNVVFLPAVLSEWNVKEGAAGVLHTVQSSAGYGTSHE